MFVAYLRTFARMGLKAIPMRADTGPIGGDLSHEFMILAEPARARSSATGAGSRPTSWPRSSITTATCEPFVPPLDEPLRRDRRDARARRPARCRPSELVTARGIEVGHIFYFGTKYSQPMGAVVAGPNGEAVPLEMGSYGIGVSRLVGALIEANHDDAGIIWPESVAPFRVGLINLRAGRRAAAATPPTTLYAKLRGAGVEVLYDDRDESPGAKFADDGSDRPARPADHRPARRSPPARSSSRTAAAASGRTSRHAATAARSNAGWSSPVEQSARR